MPRKTWTVKLEDLTIEFTNQWNFKLSSRETLLINGETVSDVKKSIRSGFQNNIVGNHVVSKLINGLTYEIEIKLGSKFPGIFLGCHIFVNGDLVWGDVNAKLLYT